MENIVNILNNAIFTDLSKMVLNRNEPYAISLVCNDEMSNFVLALSDLEDLDKLISKNKKATLMVAFLLVFLNFLHHLNCFITMFIN